MTSRSELMLEVADLTLQSLNGTLDNENLGRLEGLLKTNPLATEYYTEVLWTYIGLNSMEGISFLQKLDVKPFSHDLLSTLVQDELSSAKTERSLEKRKASALDHPHRLSTLERELLELEREGEKIEAGRVEHATGKQKPARTSARRKPLTNKERFFFIGRFAAIILIAVSVVLLDRWVRVISQGKPVASVTEMYNAAWANDHKGIAPGSRLWNNNSYYHLERGMAKVVFDSGARVLIEAPSQFQVLSENKMYFMGQMTAQVPESASGFTVLTDCARVVDLGTEFGLTTLGKDENQVHVARGKVELSDTISTETNSRVQSIEAGQGYAINRSGSISAVAYEKERFRWHVPSRYELAVLKSKPRGYWRFDRDQKNLLRNEMVSQVNDSSKLMGRIDYIEGPDLGGSQANQALYLPGTEEEYAKIDELIQDRNVTGELTIAMWIRPGASLPPDKQSAVIMFVRDKGSGLRHVNRLYFTETNSFGFRVTCLQKGMDQRTGPYAEKILRSAPVQLNRWYHVAVSLKDRERVKIYLNGELQESQELDLPIQRLPKHAYWNIGSGPLDTAETGVDYRTVPFTGSVDEISLYNRQLTDREVRMLYDARGDNE